MQTAGYRVSLLGLASLEGLNSELTLSAHLVRTALWLSCIAPSALCFSVYPSRRLGMLLCCVVVRLMYAPALLPRCCTALACWGLHSMRRTAAPALLHRLCFCTFRPSELLKVCVLAKTPWYASCQS